MNHILEYIWIDGDGGLRSKTRIINKNIKNLLVSDIPRWNFDGSSTNQAHSDGNTEILLKPCKIYKNPFIYCDTNSWCWLVLCDTSDICCNSPMTSSTREEANKLFNSLKHEECWFGLEQEFFIFSKTNMFEEINNLRIINKHYCGIEVDEIDKKIMETHLDYCLTAGVKICGINAEVCQHQWEYQIGPCVGIDGADDLIISRYILQNIANKYNKVINYNPKVRLDMNGSGCHINFSTKKMREENGYIEILDCMSKLEKDHNTYIEKCGKNNRNRLTGKNETSSYDKFTYGIGTRNTSIRIGNETYEEKKGYFEDRRPASNIDPYLVMSSLCKSIFVTKK
jgi:glutamine synthetase